MDEFSIWSLGLCLPNSIDWHSKSQEKLEKNLFVLQVGGFTSVPHTLHLLHTDRFVKNPLIPQLYIKSSGPALVIGIRFPNLCRAWNKAI